MIHTIALDALRDGLADGGAEVVTNFPGFQSHVLFARLGGTVTSVNERTAYEVAWGASLAGRRSVVTFKNVGLNVAADPFLNSLLAGVHAGMVVVVFDDVDVAGSQSRQDSRHYIDIFGGLWLEPESVDRAYHFAYDSFQWSECLQLPVVLRVTNQLLEQTGVYARRPRQAARKAPARDAPRFVVHPTFEKEQRQRLEHRMRLVRRLVERLHQGQASASTSDEAVVIFGACHREVARYTTPAWDIFQVVAYPIPERALGRFLAGRRRVHVLEQGSRFGCEKLQAVAGRERRLLSNTGSMPDHSAGYVVSAAYDKLFGALMQVAPAMVIGDLGEYTRSTRGGIDACLCLGASVGVACGVATAGLQPVFAITGDAAFLHSGRDVLPEAFTRGTDINVIVICNGGSRVTGGQVVPGNVMAHQAGYRAYRLRFEAATESQLAAALSLMVTDECASILYLEKE